MQEDIDARIQSYYTSVFDEHARLTTRSAQGPLEYVRTQEIIREHVSAGTMIDIGGGAGVHARALVDAGYVVEVLDPVSRHVEQARALGLNARVGDARELPFSAGSFDAALLLGPLYQLAAYTDRILALREAARVVGPGGFVFAPGLSRYIAFRQATLGRDVPEPYPGEWVSLAAQGKPADGMRFPAGHFIPPRSWHPKRLPPDSTSSRSSASRVLQVSCSNRWWMRGRSSLRQRWRSRVPPRTARAFAI